MNSLKVVTHGSVTLNLETIKCFKVKKNILTIEHKTRFDYISNPETDEFEKQECNDITEVEYSSYDSACAYRDEWAEIWQDYLNEK
ncbi:MAG: hypothetical protein AB7D46_10645 [Flavobacteriaceae bacterium]